MKITFLGHAGFLLEHQEVKVAIDPFITGNPAAKAKVEDIQAHYILVTHGHSDHLGDAVQIARQSNGTVVGVFEVANYCTRHGAQAHPMHIGGSYDFGKLKVKLTQALHGSSAGGEEGPAEYLGNPCGFIIELGGIKVYHAGDTGLFGDMELIGRRTSVDVAMLPIGDNFTMGVDDAVEAVNMIKPKTVIPMHYNTWPLIKQDPQLFKKKVEDISPARVVILNPGDSYNAV
ncbi:L-ascorbate metabolism protein UlaG (beta-lactamase superfamily) [Desulfohalotomaculum tongense]|uniref:metal-dependent hydrolase n=1 Tax=Desulforadius tongensis TaxID=1216062 RepID=UPI00195F14CB|nr:metal-dependent hydrolase [Desulforadius tongensis]MBM7854767.1 L-ascorbate metabolism protein UlaG (beta-lactamase superfamily) [Desulforadius tongensis]